MPLIELGLTEVWDNQKDWSKLCDASSRAAIAVSPHTGLLREALSAEVSIKLSDSDEVQSLNASYRGKDRPTNVLSFPLINPERLSLLSSENGGELLLGDIILAHEVCLHEAMEKDVSLQDHVSHLVVHGTLHLLGYDHENETDALVMENLEIEALATLGIANPYVQTAMER